MLQHDTASRTHGQGSGGGCHEAVGHLFVHGVPLDDATAGDTLDVQTAKQAEPSLSHVMLKILDKHETCMLCDSMCRLAVALCSGCGAFLSYEHY